MRLETQIPGGPVGIAARWGIAGASVAMPAVMNVRERRLRTETSISCVKRRRTTGLVGSSKRIASLEPDRDWRQRSPSKTSRLCAFQ